MVEAGVGRCGLTSYSEDVQTPGGTRDDASRHQPGAVPADHLVHLMVQGVLHRVIVCRPGRLPPPPSGSEGGGRGEQRPQPK